jgi:hypothetical protein
VADRVEQASKPRVIADRKLDEGQSVMLRVGGFVQAAAGMQHYAWFTEESVVQVHGVGPFTINYVNPADDLQKK